LFVVCCLLLLLFDVVVVGGGGSDGGSGVAVGVGDCEYRDSGSFYVSSIYIHIFSTSLCLSTQSFFDFSDSI